MKDWQPKVIDEDKSDLELTREYGFGTDTITRIHCTEGDSLFINQKMTDQEEVQRVNITRDELYNIIFNFMSSEELMELTASKQRQELESINKL